MSTEPFAVVCARSAGFCMGVRRAVELALNAAKNSPPPVATWGPLIHNPAVVEELAAHGAKVADEGNIPAAGTVVIRAHGVPPQTEETLRRRGLVIVDATCPLVKKNQELIRDAAAAGRHVVIAGDAEHAETVGLAARAAAGATVVGSAEEAAAADIPSGALLMAQTTFSQSEFTAIAAAIRPHTENLTVQNTICNATAARQTEVQNLAAACDIMVIVGGRHSANTRRLAEVAAACGTETFLVESAAELQAENFVAARRVGVSAGASTPDWSIEAVLSRLASFGGQTAAEFTDACPAISPKPARNPGP